MLTIKRNKNVTTMNSALKALPVSPDDILEMLFCICGNYVTVEDTVSAYVFIQELPDDISIYWGTVLDEDIPGNLVKVILVAAG